MTGHGTCPACKQRTVTVRMSTGLLVKLDWPPAEHGMYAAAQTAAGGWVCDLVPVGEPVYAPYKRFQEHACGEAPQDLSEPVRAAEPLRGEAFLAAVRKVKAEQARAEVNRKGRRPGKAAVAVERPGMLRRGGGE